MRFIIIFLCTCLDLVIRRTKFSEFLYAEPFRLFFCSQPIPVFGFRNRDSVIKILVDLCLDLEIETQ